MKNKVRILITTLFAGISLGVLGGINFASENKEIIQVDAAVNFTYWKQVKSISEVTDGAEVLFGGNYNGTFYYAHAIDDCNTFTNSNSDFITTSTLSDNSLLVKIGVDNPTPFKAYKSGSSLNIKDSGRGNWVARSKENWGTSTNYILGIDSDPNAKTNGRLGVVNIDSNTYYPYVTFDSKKLQFRRQDKNGWLYWTNGSSGYSTTFYMFIKAPACKITFDQNGGTGGKLSTYSYNVSNSSQYVTITKPTYFGHYNPHFGAERVGVHTKNVPTTDGTKLSIPSDFYGDIKVTTDWKTNVYKVVYNGNGNTGGSTASSNHAYGEKKELTPNGFTKTGYTFAGWSKTPDGDVNYTDKQSVLNLATEHGATVNLYAKWTPSNFSITYNNLQGSTHANPTTYNIETETIILTNPTARPGYLFDGWFDALQGGNKVTLITKGSTGDIILYAHWSIDPTYVPICINTIGGWTRKDGKKQQLVAFGFTFSGETWPVNDNDFGIIAYRSGGAEVEHANGTVQSLKDNQGRFYMFIVVDESSPVTYYAKAFVKFGGSYIYSDIVNATGDLKGEQYIID